MQVDLNVLSQVAFGVVALYLLWDRQSLLTRVMHLEEMHNKLCDSVEYFSVAVEEDMKDLEKRIND